MCRHMRQVIQNRQHVRNVSIFEEIHCSAKKCSFGQFWLFLADFGTTGIAITKQLLDRYI